MNVGFRPLLKVSLQQDRKRIAPWILLITALSVTSLIAYPRVFPDPADRLELATTIGANPALSLIFGPARDLTYADGFNAWRAGLLGAFFAALMAIFIVVRNSRAAEDSGQAELLASGVMSRETRLAVAVAIACLASVVLGVVATIATLIFGGGLSNTLALAATWTASGFMFAGVAAIAAQLGSDARTATTLSVGTLGVAYIVRGFIDAGGGSETAVWLTPLGWLEKVKPAAGNDPWPLLLALAFTAACIGVAFALQARRDFGMGLIPPRRGPDRAGFVGNPWGLALRINRGSLIAWLIAFAALGVVFGVLATSVGEVFAKTPAISAALGSGQLEKGRLLFAFLTTILSLVGIIAAVFGVGIVMRMYAEESEVRADPLLATALSRPRYLATTAVIAFAGPAIGMLIGGSVIGSVAASREPNIDAGEVFRQAVITIPPVWLLVGVAFAAVGAMPGKRLVAWLAIVASFALTILGPILRLNDRILGISPFWHVPNVTLPDPDWVGLAVVLAVSVVLTVLGFIGYRRRDLA